MNKTSRHLLQTTGLTLMFIFALAPLTTHNSAKSNQESTVIFDFEDEGQLDELRWQCGSTYTIVEAADNAGRHRLKVEMFPTVEWPGFAAPIKTSLAPYDYLYIEVFNPAKNSFNLAYRIDDRPSSPDYSDRVNGSRLIQPGRNLLTFDLRTLKTSDGRRRLEADKICNFMLFLHYPAEKTTIYLDNLTAAKTLPADNTE